MPTHPDEVRRRIALDEIQLQVVLGSLLGDGHLVGPPGHRRLRVCHAAERIDYVRWKYERLGSLSAEPPRLAGSLASFETLEHPLFDDLARLAREGLVTRLAPLGLAVWLGDVGRFRLAPDAFLPAQGRQALIA